MDENLSQAYHHHVYNQGMKMKISHFCAAIIVAFTAASAIAQTSCNTIGASTFCNGPAGSSTSSTIGGSTFINRTDGTTATANRIGSTTFINESAPGRSATHNQIGTTTFINRQDGTSATVNRIGDSTFINDSSGKTRVCNKIGETVFCN